MWAESSAREGPRKCAMRVWTMMDDKNGCEMGYEVDSRRVCMCVGMSERERKELVL